MFGCNVGGLAFNPGALDANGLGGSKPGYDGKPKASSTTDVENGPNFNFIVHQSQHAFCCVNPLRLVGGLLFVQLTVERGARIVRHVQNIRVRAVPSRGEVGAVTMRHRSRVATTRFAARNAKATTVFLLRRL